VTQLRHRHIQHLQSIVIFKQLDHSIEDFEKQYFTLVVFTDHQILVIGRHSLIYGSHLFRRWNISALWFNSSG
jgi:hypothetical protein